MKTLSGEQFVALMRFLRIAREYVAPGIPRFDEAYEKACSVFWLYSATTVNQDELSCGCTVGECICDFEKN